MNLFGDGLPGLFQPGRRRVAARGRGAPGRGRAARRHGGGARRVRRVHPASDEVVRESGGNALMARWLGLPVSAAEHAPQLDFMNEVVHWMMLVLFVGWGVFFLWTLFRFRRGRNPKADYHGVRSHFSTWSEIAVGVAEVVLLVAFAIPAWATPRRRLPARIRGHGRPRDRRAVRVERSLPRSGRRIRVDRHQAHHPGQSARARSQVDARRGRHHDGQPAASADQQAG